MAEGPSKSDIEAVFKRLRAIPTNKTCFDCGAKNPTWSTVTFGVFICIDCSSVHRNLGVHLTFVRSTQLDTQWTWLQLRNMQLGGNANAHTFFRQHNCSTLDAQQKYTSRAAILYKEKLANMSQQYMRIHGTELHVETQGHGHDAQHENKEEDFFSLQEEFPNAAPFNTNCTLAFKAPVPESTKVVPTTQPTGPIQGPNVDVIHSTPAETSEPKVAKSLIGQRKPAAKKTGLGAKKGLGATKVQANFEDIEREAHMADAARAQKPVEVKPEVAEQKAASLSLAFQELAMQTKKQSEIMQKGDPKNAEQVERIGMGVLANKGGSRATISHSITSDMTVISQDSSAVTKTNSSVLASLERNKFSSDETPSSFYSKSSGLDDLLSRNDSSSKSSRDSEWDMLSDFTPVPKSTNSAPFGASASSSSSSSYGSSFNSGAKSSNYGSSSRDASASDNGDALKKFGNAKAISSEQYFQDSGTVDYERRANLSRFEGSSGISSSDYFGSGSTSGRSRNAAPSYNIQAPDLDDVKESVRQGVTKVASKLSNLANDFASSIQDRYGY